MTLAGFQRQIELIYYDRDSRRGLEATFMWFVEEVGELSRVVRRGSPERVMEEFADVLAWLMTMASIAGVDFAEAANRYAEGCPKCRQIPCQCPEPVRA
jgi:NTP pyrophosphatase (non-canonical NTP hydrolase)